MGRCVASGLCHTGDLWGVVGTCLAFVGLAVEIVADEQKQRFKELHAETFVCTGLYKFSRHPNYMGEIIFHVGIYMGGMAAYQASSAVAMGLVAGISQFAMV